MITKNLKSELAIGAHSFSESISACRLQLIQEPTPLEQVTITEPNGCEYEFYVKREDLTSEGYGGNKIRNLEFILGHAAALGAKKLVTLGPVGSNFLAALSVHGPKIGIPLVIHQFEAIRNNQIEKHFNFTKKSTAQVKTLPRGLPKPLAAVVAGVRAATDMLSRGSYFISPGGSSVLGAMGHFESFFEMRRQLYQNSFKTPEFVFVGVGTCGTIAGLLAANILSGKQLRIVGVRCVDAVYANKMHILTLTNRLLRLVGATARIKLSDINLVDPPQGDLGYGWEHPASPKIRSDFARAGLILDSTYTDKVALVLRRVLLDNPAKKAIYWHTFSPAAMN